LGNVLRAIYLPGGVMKFVPVRNLRLKPGQVWEQLDREGDMVITSNGRPIALLTRITEEDFETTIAAARRARALLAMEAMQRAAMVAGADRISDAEIAAEIRATRRSRRR